MAVPLFSDLPASRTMFSPGDRILVKVSADLEKWQRDQMARIVCKWCKCDVNVLVVNPVWMGLNWFRNNKLIKVLCSKADIEPISNHIATANLGLTAVTFEKNDVLEFVVDRYAEKWQLEQTKHVVKPWAGDDVDVRVLPGMKIL